MGRPPGAKNKSPREIEAEAKARLKEAKLKRKIEELRKKNKG